MNRSSCLTYTLSVSCLISLIAYSAFLYLFLHFSNYHGFDVTKFLDTCFWCSRDYPDVLTDPCHLCNDQSGKWLLSLFGVNSYINHVYDVGVGVVKGVLGF